MLINPEDFVEREHDDCWELVHKDSLDQEIVDIPAQCPTCHQDAPIDFWWDGEDNAHCMRCDPPGVKAIRGRRFRELKARFDERSWGRIPPKKDGPVEEEIE